MSKICCRCELPVPVENFYKNRKSKDGLQSSCTPCQKKYMETYTPKNKQKILKRIDLRQLQLENQERIQALENQVVKLLLALNQPLIISPDPSTFILNEDPL